MACEIRGTRTDDPLVRGRVRRTIAEIDEPEGAAEGRGSWDLRLECDSLYAMHLCPNAADFSVRRISKFKLIVNILKQEATCGWHGGTEVD